MSNDKSKEKEWQYLLTLTSLSEQLNVVVAAVRKRFLNSRGSKSAQIVQDLPKAITSHNSWLVDCDRLAYGVEMELH